MGSVEVVRLCRGGKMRDEALGVRLREDKGVKCLEEGWRGGLWRECWGCCSVVYYMGHN